VDSLIVLIQAVNRIDSRRNFNRTKPPRLGLWIYSKDF
jgi:hypothetical protein